MVPVPSTVPGTEWVLSSSLLNGILDESEIGEILKRKEWKFGGGSSG